MKGLFWLVAPVALLGCETKDDIEALPVAPGIVAVDPPDPEVQYYAIFWTDPAETATPTRRATSIQQIRAEPQAWRGRTVEGRVHVLSTPSDRGFWVRGPSGAKMFALIVDEPRDAVKDINPGQTLYVQAARIYVPSELDQVPGADLEDETTAIAEEEPAFFVVDEAQLTILGSS